MKRSKDKVTSIQVLIQNYFLERLIQQRSVTSRTVESHRDTFRIYIKYLQEELNISVENISVSDFNQTGTTSRKSTSQTEISLLIQLLFT